MGKFGTVPYETLQERNKLYLKSLIAAHPDMARGFLEAEHQKRASKMVAAVVRKMEKIERRIDRIERRSLTDAAKKLVHVRSPASVAQPILIDVCARHGVTLPMLLSHRRSKEIVAARHEAMYRLYRDTSMSMPAIATRLGNFDHTTVLHGIRRHAERTGAPDLVPRKGAR